MTSLNRRKKTRAWMKQHVNDEYVQRAQKEGYRSRAVYKLKEINEKDKLIRPGLRVVDLGAAPGGWSQYVRQRMGSSKGAVLALDILFMEPLQGVEFMQGDFTEQAVLDRALESLGGAPVDLVISDMAPNISGIAVSDQARAVYLAELALEFARQVLKPGGHLLLKTFQGEGFPELRKAMQGRFKSLISRKPKASRARSREIYLLGKVFLSDQ
ncbi:MAG: 23S rRNA (uridine(2552)-2'-O)-methyltransferase RlmE [Gammaproteobacteria bacterium]|nr:MAG: 23S rRNA (uridine(2552)-2'-O)-methyltransferase RlmE [Gammaproteobacteria bacterium]